MTRKKLIEVSIPLEAINEASAREKSIRHGHPSTLHLWWARRPLAACRAVLFAQLVDDPSAWPDRFPSEEDQKRERERLHEIIEAMVPWEASTDEHILNKARFEIARSIAWGLGEEPPPRSDPAAVLAYLQEKSPPVYDPFCGGGSIPLEAQRLGLRAYGSDLNPVAVLISKALVEIPPKFAGLPPVNPDRDRHRRWKGAQGLAEDVRYYGQWMREEAEKRIGHLYPKARLPDGSEATVIAWLWARTVRSPDPSAKGAMVPLVSSFMLSTKEGKQAWVEVVRDPAAPDGWRFEVRTGKLTADEEKRLKEGTIGRSGGGTCVLTNAPMPFTYIREKGQKDGLGVRLMAVVAEGVRGRVYLPPTAEHARAATLPKPDVAELDAELPNNPRDFKTPNYGLTKWRDLFTPRQLMALTTFSDLVGEARERVLADARKAGFLPDDDRPLAEGGTGPVAYADAVATYLAFCLSKMADRGSSICTWFTERDSTRSTFARQALPMSWDFAELNTLLSGTGSFSGAVQWTAESLGGTVAISRLASIALIDASRNHYPIRPASISTDPPYYDNIGYADLSDFFYVWLRRSLRPIWPDLFRRLLTPKDEELVATPYRHGSKEAAERFFMEGMRRALQAMREAACDDVPLTLFYAFKQSENGTDGITSAGWASFLQAVVDCGLIVDGTWPLRTELANRIVGKEANVLASSIVLVCRKRPAEAPTATRAELLRGLRRELPRAVAAIREAGVGPVDMQQAVIGPGMGVFSRYARVLEDDDTPMTVKTALALVNRVWEEIENELDTSLDAPTQVALAWYADKGFDSRSAGELVTLANAKDTSLDALFAAGVFENLKGRVALVPRERLPEDWRPSTDRRLTVWECVQHTIRALHAEQGGFDAAAELVRDMAPSVREAARALAYRLFELARRRGLTAEAQAYNELAELWPKLEARGDELAERAAGPLQSQLF